MVTLGINEHDVEIGALAILKGLGWQVTCGPDIAPGTTAAKRYDHAQVVLEAPLRNALSKLNPSLPSSALDDALRELIHPVGATLEARNRGFHRMLVNGGDGGVPGQRRHYPRQSGSGHRLRAS